MDIYLPIANLSVNALVIVLLGGGGGGRGASVDRSGDSGTASHGPVPEPSEPLTEDDIPF